MAFIFPILKHGELLGAKNTQDYINKAKDFAKTLTGNGVNAKTVGKYKIKVDENTGTVFVGKGKNEIHTFYKNDGRIPNDQLYDSVVKRAENGTL